MIEPKKEQIDKLEKRLMALQEKAFYTFECKGCGKHWDSVILSSEYDRIYLYAEHAVVNESFLVLKCPECGYEHQFRKSYNGRYPVEKEPESEKTNIKTYPPNNLVSVKIIYNMSGMSYSPENSKDCGNVEVPNQ